MMSFVRLYQYLRGDISGTLGLGPLFERGLVGAVLSRRFAEGVNESVEELSLLLFAERLEHLVEDTAHSEREDRVVGVSPVVADEVLLGQQPGHERREDHRKRKPMETPFRTH